MLTITGKQANSTPADALGKLQDQLVQAMTIIDPEDGMKTRLQEGLIQLHRFVLQNIEVDTARTKNSIFPQIQGSGDTVIGRLATNVRYSPYVRDAGHDEPFFRYAARKEGASVLARLGERFAVDVAGVFE